MEKVVTARRTVNRHQLPCYTAAMRSTHRSRLLVISLCALAVACGAPVSDDPDLILAGGLIYPLGADDISVEALAIRGDSIMALGSNGEVTPLAGRYTQQMNLEDAAVLPGTYDAWIDLEALGRWSVADLDMRLASSVDEAQAMVRNAGGASAASPEWLVGWGWDENDWPTATLPDQAALDSLGIERPIVLFHRSGRAAWLNSAGLRALESAGPSEAGSTPVQTVPGIVSGDALSTLAALVGGTPDERRAWIAEGARQAAAAGITRAATPPVGESTIDHLLELEFRGLLPVRVDARLTVTAAAAYAGSRLANRVADSALVRVIAVGVRLDGPLASRLAAVSEPYTVAAPLAPPPDEGALRNASAAARAAALPLHIQASGDAAVAAALETLAGEPAGAALIGADLLPASIPETLAGLQVGMAAARFARDIYWLDRLLGPERATRAHAWHDVSNTGATLVFAADAPAATLRPLAAMASAMTRQDPTGYPAGGWNTLQGLPQHRLVRALVGEAAGLVAGRPADLVVWSEDPVRGDPAALRRAEALLTIVAGRVAYSRARVDLPQGTGQQR